jgi:phosphoglycolate phosphatase
MNHLVILDLDGTLVDAFRDIQAAVNAMLESHGYRTLDIATIRGFVGNGVVRLVERCLPPEGQQHLDKSIEFVRDYYQEHPADHATLYPGVETCLRRLRNAGVKLAILSNKPHEITLEVAHRLGLDRLVDLVQGEQRNIPMKPDPTTVLMLKSEFGAESLTVVGDGLPDAELARNLGARFIGVDWGISSRAQLEPFGTVVSSLEEIPELLLPALQQG